MALRLAPRALLLALVPLALVPGCGSNGPRLAQVSGTVTHGGQPLARLEVNFAPESGRPSVSRTDAEGHYVLDYDRERKGALLGKHKVWVKFLPKSPIDEPSRELSAILEKYGNAKTSPITVEVKDESQVFDLPLD
jgi:hypothetical protein